MKKRIVLSGLLAAALTLSLTACDVPINHVGRTDHCGRV